MAAKPPAECDPYSRFGEVYDDRAHDRVAEAFFRTLVTNLGTRQREGACNVLEMACGTGLLLARLAGWGFSVVGVDRSAVMLRQARSRCRAFGSTVRLVQSDMRAPGVRGAFDLVLVCADVVNHFSDPRDLERVFAAARDLLLEGGLLVFDALKWRCFEEYWDDRVYFYEGDAGYAVMRSTWRPKRREGEVEIWSFVRSGDGRYSLAKDRLTEYYHAPEALENLLVSAGFSSVESRDWSPWAGQSREGFLDRDLWMARR